MILIQASDQNLIFGRQKFLALPFPADFYRKHVEEDEILEVLALLAEGSRIRTFTRAKGIKEDTVLRWLREAARHADKLAACVSPPPTCCALCCSDCAASRARRTLALDPARLRGLSCAAGRLRRTQAFVDTVVCVFFFMGISNGRHVHF